MLDTNARLLSALARALIRLYPRRWRRRYEGEVLDMVSRAPLRWRDLFDLIRSAADGWEHDLTRAPWRPAKVVVVSYAVLISVWWLTALACNWALMLVPRSGTANPGFIHPRFFLIHWLGLAAVFWTPLFVAGLVVNLPLILALRLARGRVSVPVARLAAAAGLAIWIQWAYYQAEWFDVWRHGVPDFRYFVSGLVPLGVAFACAGAVIGGALAGGRDRTPVPGRVR